jgi:hypothetical protein
MVSMGTELKIDPELEAVCLPLSDEEFDLLEKQVIRDGCQDALKVWDRDGELILLDGHNRLKICKKHKLPYDTSTIEIASIDEAVIWIVDNQKGRRNVATKEQQDYISGKRYEAEKNLRAGRPEKTASVKCADNLYISPDGRPHQNRTILNRAQEEGVSHFTIGQNQKFAQGVDAIREVSPELAEKILKPDPVAPKLTKSTVAALPKLKAENPVKFVEAVQEIHDALETKDKTTIAKVVRDHVSPDEPTHEEKMIAKKHHLMPEHVRYANEHHIPIEKLKTVEQIDATNPRTPKTCSAIWDGFYECSCGIQFEIFRSVHAPACCPHCGKPDNLKRSRGV